MKAKLPYDQALGLAQLVLQDLSPFCERIEIAGSIRREKAEVGDIEIVAIPRKIALYDLFGEPAGEVNELDGWASRVGSYGWKVLKNGPFYKQFDIGACKLDLFVTTPEKWGVIYLIRTGSAEFVHRLVTPRRYGGLMPSNLKVSDGRIWQKGDGQPLPTPEETDVFNLIDCPWLEPMEREG